MSDTLAPPPPPPAAEGAGAPQPQLSPEQMMQMMAMMGGAGGAQPPGDPPPSPRKRLLGTVAALWAFVRWLFARPQPSEDQPGPPEGLPARAHWYAHGALKAVVNWFLPPLDALGPAPLRDYHGPDGKLHRLANTYPLPTWRTMARLVISLLVIFLAWAQLAVLDEVAIAEGEVVPEGKVKVIQHLEGGVIREIYTVEGAEVKEGEPLLLLELAVSSVNREELQVRLDGYHLQRARLVAELNGTPLAFPPDEAKRQPSLLEAEGHSYEARHQALKASLSVLQQQVQQKGLEVNELETKRRALANNLRLSTQRFEMSKDLIRSGLTSKMDHVTAEAQMEDLRGQLDSVQASIPRSQAAQQEARQRMEEERARFIRTAQQEMSECELNIARTRELLAQASDQQRRTQITSPIDGIVKNMRSNTIGGVIKAGDPIMEMVPLHERLQIDAKLSPMDRGYVQTGQKATVKLSAYDYTTYGGLEGEVILVAPDTTIGGPPQNQPYYRVVVQTDKSYIGDESDKRPITAGMQATVEIHTGARTVMEFLVKPVVKLRHEAFRER
ncbi:MAG: HlyD family type I secretion periplasmic adaptor subunit [Magnetospirillum sp.]|nr:HlyD family type I secretion periplasmic adaptor subunit [Magnetospirillum sp.]